MPRNNMNAIFKRPILVLLAALAVSFSAAAREGGGKLLRDHGCLQCHAVHAAGIEPGAGAKRLQGPDLSGLGQRYGAELLADYLKQELAVPGRGAHGFKGTDEELQALVDWLLEQK